MTAPREIELKLELDPARSTRRRRAPDMRGLTGIRPESETRRLASAIFDTQDHALRRKGLVLRIRRDGDRRIQTLKAGEGAFARAEWESDIAGDEPDLAAIPDAALREEVGRAGALAIVLETEFERTLWQLRHHGSDVELAFDRGTIRAGARTAPIHEIEIELKAGAPTALFGVAREILGTLSARLALRSKSERGYELLGAKGRSGKAEPFRVHRKMNVAAAFQEIARNCLRQYQANEPGILAREAEALHRGRVAIRRLRSLLKLHRKLVADPEGERLRRGLRTFSQGLGAARNLDVYLGRLDGEDDGTGGLRARLSAEREVAYDRLTARLRSKRTRVLLLDVMAYVETGDWLRDPDRRKLRERKVRRFAAKALGKRWRDLREDGRDLAAKSAEARHEVRIDGKVLRYAAEFFAGAYPGGKAKRRRSELLDALADLQTHLGDLNDIQTGMQLSDGRAEDGVASPGAVADPEREAALLASAQLAHERLCEATPFWD